MKRPETKHLRIWARKRTDSGQGKQQRKRRDPSELLLPELAGLPSSSPSSRLLPRREEYVRRDPSRRPRCWRRRPESASAARCSSAGSGPSKRLLRREDATDGARTTDDLLPSLLLLLNLSAATAGGVASPGYCPVWTEDRGDEVADLPLPVDGGDGEDPRVQARLVRLDGMPWW